MSVAVVPALNLSRREPRYTRGARRPLLGQVEVAIQIRQADEDEDERVVEIY